MTEAAETLRPPEFAIVSIQYHDFIMEPETATKLVDLFRNVRLYNDREGISKDNVQISVRYVSLMEVKKLIAKEALRT